MCNSIQNRAWLMISKRLEQLAHLKDSESDRTSSSTTHLTLKRLQ